jgi:hypothetical protein
MSAGTAAALDLGFDVLVPTAVPAPFGGEPSVYAVPGYYSLYWVVYGGPPTFLEITGEVGGDIPDGSAYDLNVELVVNADVQGYPAYRDLTPIYDTVWWQVGDVVYSVSSQNLAGTDSLSLANALTVLVPPAGGEPGGGDGGGDGDGDGGAAPGQAAYVWSPAEVASGGTITVWVEGDGVVLEADDGYFVDTGTTTHPDAAGRGVVWQAPAVASDQAVSFVVVDAATGEWLAVSETVVIGDDSAPEDDANQDEAMGASGEDGEPADDEADTGAPASQAEPSVVELGCPAVVYSGRLAPVRLRGSGEVVVEASLGGWPDEPGNRRFDGSADGGPDLTGDAPDEAAYFLHWRAPAVRGIVGATFSARGPDGVELDSCTTNVRPGPPPPRAGEAPVGDGTGGPRPNGPGPTGVGGVGSNAEPGDATGGQEAGIGQGDGAAGTPAGAEPQPTASASAIGSDESTDAASP